MLTAQENEDDKLTGLELGADDYILSRLTAESWLAGPEHIKTYRQKRWANPLTGLRGNIEIQTEVTKVATKQHLRLFMQILTILRLTSVYGFASGDRVKLTADIIIDNVHNCGNPEDFVGHIGGDDFIIVSTPNKAELICKGNQRL